jgi:nicotinate phosphoribosyltransferase
MSQRICDPKFGVPHSDLVDATLTDFYQITMAYAYWKSNKHEDHAVFDLFFRKPPFGGEFTVCAGIEEVQRFLNSFHFSDGHIDYLRTQLPSGSDIETFFKYLKGLDCSQVTVFAMREGEFIFPREPVLRVEGPLGVCQLLETPLLNLMNYPCLIATQAARLRIAAGPDKVLIEFGCRRAQGPDGAVTASRYSYLAGFDGENLSTN